MIASLVNRLKLAIKVRTDADRENVQCSKPNWQKQKKTRPAIMLPPGTGERMPLWGKIERNGIT